MSKSMYKKKDIPTLVVFAQAGDNKALEEIIKRVQKNIYAMFGYLTEKRSDISDLTQDALLKMAKNINTLKDPKNFKPWLNRIVTNIFYDYIKKHSREDNFEIDADKILEIKDKIGCEPGEKCLFAEMEQLVRSALLNLPDNLRLVIVLREYEGLSYADISQIANIPQGTVKSRISRARLKLREQLMDFI